MNAPSRKVQVGLAAAVAVLLFSVLALAIHATPAWVQQPGTPNDTGAITDALFGPLVIPFEVLGILLTAAMIGALTIARPLTVHGDEETSLVHPNLTTQTTDSTERTETPLSVESVPSVVSSGPTEAQA